MATEQTMSKEDQFFGVKTTIEKTEPKAAEGEDPKYVVEVDESADPTPADKSGKPVAKRPPADDDLSGENLSERVQKRVNHLTWEREEARREAKKAMDLQNEAIRAAQALNQKNLEYQNIITSGEGELVERIKRGAAASAEAAKMEYRKAYEAGDTEQMLQAHERLINSQTELREAQNYDANYRQRMASMQAAQMQRQYAPPPPPPPRQPTPEAQDWASQNPWFGDPRHRDMTAIAIATHENLVRDRGFKPDTDAYYEELNHIVRSRFPEYFESDAASSSGKRPATVVASAKRGNPPPSRKVKLTPSAVALAKKLGLTLEQYADQVIKGQAND